MSTEDNRDKISVDFAINLKREVESSGEPRSKIAQKAGICRAQLDNLINQKSKSGPRLDNAWNIARALGVSLLELCQPQAVQEVESNG